MRSHPRRRLLARIAVATAMQIRRTLRARVLAWQAQAEEQAAGLTMLKVLVKV